MTPYATLNDRCLEIYADAYNVRKNLYLLLNRVRHSVAASEGRDKVELSSSKKAKGAGEKSARLLHKHPRRSDRESVPDGTSQIEPLEGVSGNPGIPAAGEYMGRPRGFGFVEMSNAGASRAIQALNNRDFEGRALRVSEALDRDRSGGGRRGGLRRY